MKLDIYPKVGVGRLGNSPGPYYLAPDRIGGLPYEVDANGAKDGPVRKFKDEAGRVRRQGQLFQVFDEGGNEITANTEGVVSLVWTVHLANKKAVWYQYSELKGNLLYGEGNSYGAQKVIPRNATIEGESNRQTLIVDPGPRTISGPNQSIGFDRGNAPAEYPVQYPNSKPKYGSPVRTLGELRTDSEGRLIVVGAFGNAGGDDPLTSYGGSDTWHDDIADGPVYCTVTYDCGEVDVLKAWAIIGSPDFAPEIVNISTLSDTMFDVGVRTMDLVPEMCRGGEWNPDFQANYQRDILPIIKRLAGYQWVANVQSMSAFFSNIFDFSDNSAENKGSRLSYFNYFRALNEKSNSDPDQPQNHLFKQDGGNYLPGMPINSGSNSVSNTTTVKFLSLDATQFFLLEQWAEGKFVSDPNFIPYPISERDMASIGNCVGLPMCPGIEVTWSLQNPALYEAPFVIRDFAGPGGYDQTGLTPMRDECEGGGCQPGDLTKRMACPWQADFFQCTVQPVNFTDPAMNKNGNEPLPPTYYAYWWPPQSPWDVLTGEITADGQAASHLPAGQQMNYARGVNTFVQMVEHWSALAFIRDNNAGNEGFPFFTETERTNEIFSFEEMPVSEVSQNPQDKETTIPVFYIKPTLDVKPTDSPRAKALVARLEEREFRPIAVHEDGLGLPKSGTRIRR